MKRIKHFILILLNVAMIMPFLVMALPSNVYAYAYTTRNWDNAVIEATTTAQENYIRGLDFSTIEAASVTVFGRWALSEGDGDNGSSFSATLEAYDMKGVLLASNTKSKQITTNSTIEPFIDLSDVNTQGYLKITYMGSYFNDRWDNWTVYASPRPAYLYIKEEPKFNANSYVQSNGNLT